MDLRDRSFSVAKTNLAKKESLVKKARNKLKKLEKEFEKAEEELEAAESDWEVAQFQVEIFKRKRNIEELFWRFPHIGEQILEKIDNSSVANCRKVNKWWCNFVDQGKALVIRRIQRHICISKEKLRKSLNKLSLEVLTKFEDRARMFRKFADYGNASLKNNLKNRESYTVEECRKKIFMSLISDLGKSNSEPFTILVCNLMLDNMDSKNPTCELYGTSLHAIVRFDNLVMFKLIFEKMENKNPKDESGHTLLHIAAKNGCFRICKFILENSDTGNINEPNRYGKTPLNLAKENNHNKICKFLRSAISEQNNIPRNPRKKRKLT